MKRIEINISPETTRYLYPSLLYLGSSQPSIKVHIKLLAENPEWELKGSKYCTFISIRPLCIHFLSFLKTFHFPLLYEPLSCRPERQFGHFMLNKGAR